MVKRVEDAMIAPQLVEFLAVEVLDVQRQGELSGVGAEEGQREHELVVGEDEREHAGWRPTQGR